jgi:hypothetical protein
MVDHYTIAYHIFTFSLVSIKLALVSYNATSLVWLLGDWGRVTGIDFRFDITVGVVVVHYYYSA